MKTLMMIVLSLFVIGLIAYTVMAVLSQKTPDTLGLVNDQLRACPDSPNCVCSESHSQASKEHAIEPIKADSNTWQQLKFIIIEQGGSIQSETSHYLHATFTSPIFRYVDDVELRLDEGNHIIHIRSASRMGRSDFGVNRQRVTKITAALKSPSI